MRRSRLFVVALVLPFVGNAAAAGGWRGGHGSFGHGMTRPGSRFAHGFAGRRHWRGGHGFYYPFYGGYFPFYDDAYPGDDYYSYPATPSVQVNIEVNMGGGVAPRERPLDNAPQPHWVHAPQASHAPQRKPGN